MTAPAFIYMQTLRTWQRINAAHDWHAPGIPANDISETAGLQQAGAAPGGTPILHPDMEAEPAGGAIHATSPPIQTDGRLR